MDAVDNVLLAGAGPVVAGRPCRLTSVPDASRRPPGAAVDVWTTVDDVMFGVRASSSSSPAAPACRRPVVASSDSLGSRIPPLT